ncbi:MAG: FTR1 family iron permease [Gammaproteobacteria bacterium]|nr:FTR1 family iron permease [Gammaproteobacteria bacterium]
MLGVGPKCSTWLCALLLVCGLSGPVSANSTVDFTQVVEDITLQAESAIANYKPQSGLYTATQISDIYFDVFEASGMEMAIGVNDPALKTELESLFASVIGAASNGYPKEQVVQAWQSLATQLNAAAKAQVQANKQQGELGFWGGFLQSFFILLREGFEAMLVVMALTTYLQRQGAQKQQNVIYLGVVLALIASAVTAWLLNHVLSLAGTEQEALEGVTMLVAAALLFYVSFWLLSKRDAARWQQWIEGQVGHALSKGNVLTLGLTGFLAVYREGAETVLFYQALLAQSAGQVTSIGFGFIAASIALLGLYFVMKHIAQKLPLGLFFGITAILLFYLALSFAGTGVLELQEAGWITITPLNWVPRASWLGLYPSVETVTAQLSLLLPLVLSVGWWAMKRK